MWNATSVVEYLVQRIDKNGFPHIEQDISHGEVFDILFTSQELAKSYCTRRAKQLPEYEWEVICRVTTEFKI